MKKQELAECETENRVPESPGDPEVSGTPEAVDKGVDYMCIAAALRDEIRAGVYGSSDPFPSLTKIMRRFGVSRPSAVRSISELKRMGLVVVRKGAGTFVSNKNRKIGLAIPGTADSEFFSAIMDGIVINCSSWGSDLVAGDMFPMDPSLRATQAERLARHFVATRVAGVIMQPVGFAENADAVNRTISTILREAQIPVVLVDYDIAKPPARSMYDLVAIDNFGAGRKIAAHLLSAGAKRICCLLRSLCAESVHTRFSGIDCEVSRAQRGRHIDIFVAEPDDEKAISAAIKKYKPDAIVCPNDIAAAKLELTLATLGIHVPKDVMVAGFDDVCIASTANPPLTTIRQPCREIANMAFKTLLERMNNPDLPPREILLDTSLIVRESTVRTEK